MVHSTDFRVSGLLSAGVLCCHLVEQTGNCLMCPGEDHSTPVPSFLLNDRCWGTVKTPCQDFPAVLPAPPELH